MDGGTAAYHRPFDRRAAGGVAGTARGAGDGNREHRARTGRRSFGAVPLTTLATAAFFGVSLVGAALAVSIVPSARPAGVRPAESRTVAGSKAADGASVPAHARDVRRPSSAAGTVAASSTVRPVVAILHRARDASLGPYRAIVDAQEWDGAAYAWAELRLTRAASGDVRIDGLRGRGAGGTIRLAPGSHAGSGTMTVSPSNLQFIRFGVAAAALRSPRGESVRAFDPSTALRCFEEHPAALTARAGPALDGLETTEIAWSRGGVVCAGEPATDAALTLDLLDVDARTARVREHRQLSGHDIVTRVRYRDEDRLPASRRS